jgi:SAM-dependent methyltransferase
MSDRLWDDVADNEQATWYLDPLVAAQKKAANLNLFRRWIKASRVGTILKTDLFEEANGSDEVLSGLSECTCVIGMDIAPNMVARAKRRYTAANALFLATDVQQIALASGVIDVVFSNSTLDHFSSEDQFTQSLQDLSRVLRPGGTIIITLDNPMNPLYTALKLSGRIGWTPFKMGYTTSLSGLVAALDKVGIEVIATDYMIHNPRLVSTTLFLVVRRVLGRFADRPIRLLLSAFGLLDRLPTRSYTSCFIAAHGRKRG